MTSERLRDMLKVKPFRPFGLRLADGEVVPVRHPEMIATSPSGRTLAVFTPKDQMKVLDLFLVTALETLPEKRGNGSTGKPKKRPR